MSANTKPVLPVFDVAPAGTDAISATVGHEGQDVTEGIGGRRTPRRSYRRPVGILIRGRYEVLEGRSLSEGGVMVALMDGTDRRHLPRFSAEDLPVGARLTASIILPTGSVIVLRGEVIYHQGDEKVGHTVGIKFDGVPLHQRREIRNYVSSKKAGESSLN